MKIQLNNYIKNNLFNSLENLKDYGNSYVNFGPPYKLLEIMKKYGLSSTSFRNAKEIDNLDDFRLKNINEKLNIKDFLTKNLNIHWKDIYMSFLKFNPKSKTETKLTHFEAYNILCVTFFTFLFYKEIQSFNIKKSDKSSKSNTYFFNLKMEKGMLNSFIIYNPYDIGKIVYKLSNINKSLQKNQLNIEEEALKGQDPNLENELKNELIRDEVIKVLESYRSYDEIILCNNKSIKKQFSHNLEIKGLNTISFNGDDVIFSLDEEDISIEDYVVTDELFELNTIVSATTFYGKPKRKISHEYFF